MYRYNMQEIHKRLQNLTKYIFLQWIPGHNGISGNKRCDEIVKIAAQMQPKPSLKMTASAYLEQIERVCSN